MVMWLLKQQMGHFMTLSRHVRFGASHQFRALQQGTCQNGRITPVRTNLPLMVLPCISFRNRFVLTKPRKFIHPIIASLQTQRGSSPYLEAASFEVDLSEYGNKVTAMNKIWNGNLRLPALLQWQSLISESISCNNKRRENQRLMVHLCVIWKCYELWMFFLSAFSSRQKVRARHSSPSAVITTVQTLDAHCIVYFFTCLHATPAVYSGKALSNAMLHPRGLFYLREAPRFHISAIPRSLYWHGSSQVCPDSAKTWIRQLHVLHRIAQEW